MAAIALEKSVVDKKCEPAVLHPVQLVSWWNMQKFSAAAYLTIAKYLASLRVRFEQQAPDYEQPPIEEPARKTIQGVVNLCRQIGLRISAKSAEKIIELGETVNKGAKYKQAIEQLENIIHWEMEEQVFLYMPPKQAEHYNKPELLGSVVASKFPSARFDVLEAGNCYATGRFTACVFHLMRVLEIGLTALGKPFGVSLAHTNWAPAIEQIESRVRDMHKDPTWKALSDCKEQQEFYAQAASHFYVLKDAWRNYTAHARGKYTEEEALIILQNVSAFMRKLATKLAE